MKQKVLSIAVATAAFLGGFVLIGVLAPQANAGGTVSAFTLVTPKSVSDTRLQVRAVIPTGISCPKLKIVTNRGKTVRRNMIKRVPGATTGAAFASLRACQANIPKIQGGIRSANVGPISVPHQLPPTFDKIVMFGDTGCRVDTNSDLTFIDIQDCSKTFGTDPAAYWPLSRNASAIAREKPDLTVFTGDFFYREDPCPPMAEYQAMCGGSPPPIDDFQFNDTDYAWMADVFIPLTQVFRTAPILAIRGNHEQCDRGGNGWFLFFEVTTELGADACAPEALGGPTTPNITPSWAFDAPIAKGRTLRLVAVDSAYGRNFDITDWVDQQRPKYVQAEQLSTPKRGRESWLLTHRPMFGIEPVEEADPGKLQWTAVDQTASAQGLISNYELMVASHVHVSQVVKIPDQPIQMVVGNGGSKPDISTQSSYTTPPFGPMADAAGAPLDPAYPPYPTASYDWTRVVYGYTVMQPGKQAKRWTATQRDYTGKTFAVCSLTGKNMTCADAR